MRLSVLFDSVAGILNNRGMLVFQQFSTRNLTLSALIMPTMLALMFSPPPIHDAVPLLWVYVIFALPLRLVLSLVVMASLLSANMFNLILLPGVILGLVAATAFRNRLRVACFVCNLTVLNSILLSSYVLTAGPRDVFYRILGSINVFMPLFSNAAALDPLTFNLFLFLTTVTGSACIAVIDGRILHLILTRIDPQQII